MTKFLMRKLITKSLKLRLKLSLNFKEYLLDTGKLFCDISTSEIHPFISESLRMIIFLKIINLDQSIVKSGIIKIVSRFIWMDIPKDVNQLVKSCILFSKRTKLTDTFILSLSYFEETYEKFTIVHIDIIYPFTSSEGKRYCLIYISYFTC